MLEAELRVATEAARKAGVEVARMRREGLRYGHKEGFELVSDADLRAAEMLHEALAVAFPDTGWLSEEHQDTAERLDRERVWIVDPIDGTREFLMGIPEYAISVGLTIGGKPALGVVYNPATDEMHAATCTEAIERPSLLPASYHVLVGRGEGRFGIPALPKGALPAAVGSVAYRLALLAAGKGDVTLTGYGRSEWDVAAGFALCLAAGFRATDIFGEPVPFNQEDPAVRGLLVARPALHDHLRRWLGQYA